MSKSFERIEPEAFQACEQWTTAISAGGNLDVTATNAASLLSIAISLKRIADAMQEPNEYGEVGSAALSGAISRGLRDR